MSLPDKFIVFLGRTFSGHNHDYIMLKQEFPPEMVVYPIAADNSIGPKIR